jgi:cold shock CspA family protein
MNDTVFTGKLRQWNKDKGFGFLGQSKGKRDIFIHGSELQGLSRKPRIGDMVSYQVISSKGGETQAINGHIKGVSAPQSRSNTQGKSTQKLVTFIAIFFGIVVIVNIVKYFI